MVSKLIHGIYSWCKNNGGSFKNQIREAWVALEEAQRSSKYEKLKLQVALDSLLDKKEA